MTLKLIKNINYNHRSYICSSIFNQCEKFIPDVANNNTVQHGITPERVNRFLHISLNPVLSGLLPL